MKERQEILCLSFYSSLIPSQPRCQRSLVINAHSQSSRGIDDGTRTRTLRERAADAAILWLYLS
jgi:hypothetical protein